MEEVLVIAPHMDDEILGVGGTISWHINRGHKVVVCFVCQRAYNHKYVKKYIDEQKKAAAKAKNILGYHECILLNLKDELLDTALQTVIISLEKVVNKIKPDVVYLPHRGDNNQDHKTIFQAAMVVLRNFAAPHVKEIYSYEISSSTEQSPPFAEYAFLPNYFIDISPYLKRKLEALACYVRESRKFPHPRSLEAVQILAKKRGIQAMLHAAEAFEVIRIIRK